jgi:hypothetical protein
MIKSYCIALAFIISSFVGWSQENKEKIISNGKPIATLHANVYSGINAGDNPTGFVIRRAYLGYQFNLPNNFHAQFVLDIGSPDDVSDELLKKRVAYFKYAMVYYQKEKIRLCFGMIPTTLFKVQEKIWGHRYIAKTVTDAQKMGSSADLGMAFHYAAFKAVSFDVAILNGEGYSSIQNDGSYRVAAGVTIKPFKGLTYRAYADYTQKNASQITFLNFISYNWKNKVILSAEYAKQNNYQFVKDQDLTVWSVYASYNMSERWQLFGRFDQVESNLSPSYLLPWHLAKDGSYTILGLQYTLQENVKLALDYKLWNPPNSLEQSSEQFVYFNVMFKI